MPSVPCHLPRAVLLLLAAVLLPTICQAALVVTPPETVEKDKYISWKADSEVKFELIGVGNCTIYSDLASASIPVDLAKQTSIGVGKVKDLPGIFTVRINHEIIEKDKDGREWTSVKKYFWTILSLPIDAQKKTFALDIQSDAATKASKPDRSVTLLGQFVEKFKDNKELREKALKDAWSTFFEQNKDGLAITAGTCATGVITAGAGFFIGLCVDRTIDHVAELVFLFLKNCVKALRVPLAGEATFQKATWDQLDKILDDLKGAWDMTNALKLLKNTANAGDAIEKAEFLKDFFMGSGAFDTTDKSSGVTLTLTLEQTTQSVGDDKTIAGYQLRWKLSKAE